MSITKITDHAERAKNRLPEQFNGAANLLSLLDALGSRYQGMEDVIDDLTTNRKLSTATGLQLDNIGTILNTDRIIGELDNVYRSRIFAATSQLEKSGEVESLIELYYFLMNPVLVRFQEIYPAGVQLTAHTDTDPNDTETDILNRTAMGVVKSGGIEMLLYVAPENDDFYLSDVSEVDGSNNGPTDILHGLGDEALTDGGKLARVF